MTEQMLGHVLSSSCKMYFQAGVGSKKRKKKLKVTVSERKMCLERRMRLFMTWYPVTTKNSPLGSCQSKEIELLMSPEWASFHSSKIT